MRFDRARLAAISFATLFFEMALVRFINANVQVVAYFNNFLILSAFLGIGFGCVLAARGRTDWFVAASPLLAAVVGMTLLLDRVDAVGGVGGAVIWLVHLDRPRTLPAWFEIALVFFANFAFFVPLGNELGRTFARIENKLAAYSWDLAGSFAGIGVFAFLSYEQSGPMVWFAIGGAVLFAL